ncbi:TPA: hypothetical protein JBF32_14290 [Legionella pneumophila]|uniref:hypothetical protein n=1 Tax=Legionella pneumophila TaxID=446 RepID=UPI001A3608D9|nr:hypothetical protein [Legionella pneumophila]HAT9099625.1 hypothetical protein [Legionella pneumophila subsp. pneumophila]MDW8914954.1 hypothetical protein [Legionella pneumophila]MDW9078388.1 hypothetical protein [Legionella pneumophila]MDW9084370.1 hypothetical protein [Legionella pneumophila]
MSLYPLPDLVLFESFDSDWNNYQNALYQLFLDKIDRKLSFLGLPIRCRYLEPVSEMHGSFWHLITSGPGIDEDRIVDFRRCERISWIPHIIQHSGYSEILCWENKRESNMNTVLWLPPEQYMIILSKRKDYYSLTTAYVHDERKGRTNQKESSVNRDPRKS